MSPEQIKRMREVVDHVSDYAEQLEKGWKVETTDGEVKLVMMSPNLPHTTNVDAFREQIREQTPDVSAVNDTDMTDPVTGLEKVPDLMAFPTADVDPQAESVDPRTVLLVVEIVSKGNPKNDLVTKVEDYPRMGIPLYIVVDPRDGAIVVHSEPKEGPDGLRYRSSVPYEFGDTVPAGRWTFDTSGLVRYR
ncbi:Uma2 family endonuclease [Streptomyces sp. MUM 178J]|uniref:Uma2 family endonuclease n=1 Tax=Streptomyces sp. MUM 178J TaxID=2791991 RepID=UPI001F040BC4|nr:Uma2 family endonuclease [Streptomyces sp. MUM 178J]WRQ82714.1 Uma2 family endonuclease [Streptomyces sp. MUM 178J]